MIFFNEGFTTYRYDEEWYENVIFLYFLACKRPSNDVRRDGKGRRVSGDAVGSWFQNHDFGEEILGGATVEQLKGAIPRSYQASAVS